MSILARGIVMRTRVNASRVASRARSPALPARRVVVPSRVAAGSRLPGCARAPLRCVHLAARAEVDVEVETAETTFDPPWSAPGYRGATVSSLPAAAQAASVAGVWAALGAATYLTCAVVGPAVADAFPGYAAWSRSTWPVLGLTYVAAGLAHFALPGGFRDMYPHRGAWGFWYLPGTPEFHVAWTGVAEILGGLGMASALLPLDAPEWITPTAAYGMFLLTLAVTPANTYMWTHNAPGPLPENPDESMLSMAPPAHAARGALQVLLLSVCWGLAHPPG